MKREEAAKWAELYQAYAEGEQLQILGDDGVWFTSTQEVRFHLNLSYRVKPATVERVYQTVQHDKTKEVSILRPLVNYKDKTRVGLITLTTDLDTGMFTIEVDTNE